MNKFRIGAELDKQIYKEGEPTWGCKSGVIDVEDFKDFIEILKKRLFEDPEPCCHGVREIDAVRIINETMGAGFL